MNTAIYTAITEQPLEYEQVLAHLHSPEHGALLIFAGVVRQSNEGKRVKSITYDAHAPLAERVFTELCSEAIARFGDSIRAAIIHRIGALEIGDTSVLIGVASPHRAEAYKSSRYLIEEIKKRAPIWKNEVYEDGDSKWLEGVELTQEQ